MASANFEDTQVFKVWGQLGVEFRSDSEFRRSSVTRSILTTTL